MATILELAARGDLERYDPQLDEDEQEFRAIYLLRRVSEKLQARLEAMESKWDVETSPIEQFDEIAYHFTSGGALDYPRQFHELYHRGDGFWEIKTADLRLFGFFPKRDCFICTDVADKNLLADGDVAYSGYIEQGGFHRSQLDLDPPKFITGTETNNVVSNCIRT